MSSNNKLTVKELMERANTSETGRAIAYIKDGLREINMIHETHLRNTSMNVVKDQRNYAFPSEAIKVVDIKCKNHLNSKDEYRSIPRLIHEPVYKDND
tara:strand:- start:1026 stop:1319 length:294 start_codon:yes stop_codon:yes gene_type:complete